MTGNGGEAPDGVPIATTTVGAARRVVAARKSAAGKSTAAADSGGGKPPKKAAAKKTAAKKTTAKKTAKKSPAKKAAAKKAPTTRSAAKVATKVAPEKLAVRADERPWTEAELAEVRKVLEVEASRLRAEISDAEDGIAEMLRDSTDSGGEDQADTGSKTFEREHEMSLAASHREILGQTERALTRIDDGTYGICEHCGNPIGKARLKAFPRATLCMTCKEREERR